MTTREFIEVFDTILEAPGGIDRLRELVLQLAVRGRLVLQDSEDEPASELLKRAKTAKIREKIERKIRRENKPELSESVGETNSPTHWVWTHLYDFALVLGGKRLPAGASFSAEKTDNIYIRVTDMKDGSISTKGLQYISDDVRAQIAKYTIDREDLYITIAGTIGDAGEVPEHFHGQNLTENAAKIVFREVDKKFLLLILRSRDVQDQFQEKMKQMAQPKLALKRISGVRVPIPPLAEQHRIVAKVNELIELIDQLEATHCSRETIRNAGRDAALDALCNAATPAEVETAWTRIAERVEDLFTTPDDLTPLREAVLQLAVRGRLVPQNPNDEPATALFERILADKKLKPERRLIPVNEVDVPWRLPSSWIWVRLRQIVNFTMGKTPPTRDTSYWSDESGHPWVSIADMDHSGIVSETKRCVTPKATSEVFGYPPVSSGTTLMSFKLTIGKIAKLGIDAYHNEAIIALYPIIDEMDTYLFQFMPLFSSGGSSKGAIKGKTLNSTSLSNLLVALPPLAEQHRIVAKVNELMGLIDRLEQHLSVKGQYHEAFAAAAVYHL